MSRRIVVLAVSALWLGLMCFSVVLRRLQQYTWTMGPLLVTVWCQDLGHNAKPLQNKHDTKHVWGRESARWCHDLTAPGRIHGRSLASLGLIIVLCYESVLHMFTVCMYNRNKLETNPRINVKHNMQNTNIWKSEIFKYYFLLLYKTLYRILMKKIHSI